MKKLSSLFFLLIVLAVFGCATTPRVPDMHIIPTAPEPTQTAPEPTQTAPEPTQTAPEPTQTAPEYTHAIPIPLKVGVLLDDSLVSSSYGLVVIKEWENMQLFDSLVYPYQENDLVDIVMRLSINRGGEEVISDTEEVVERELENEEGYVVKEVVQETLLKMRDVVMRLSITSGGEEVIGISMSSLMADTHVVNASCNDARFGACTSDQTAFTHDEIMSEDFQNDFVDYCDSVFTHPGFLELSLRGGGPLGLPFVAGALYCHLQGPHVAVSWGPSTGSSGSEWGGWSYKEGGGVRVPRTAQGATFTHDALAVINQSSDEIGQYSVQVATTIQLGKNPLKDAHGRNYVEGYDAGYDLQGKRLAFELAKKIRADRQNLLSRLGKSQEGATTP